MSSYKRESKRVWKKFVCWCGLGKSRTQKKPLENIPLQQTQNTNIDRNMRSGQPRSAHATYHPISSSPSTCAEPRPFIPELAHLNAERKPRRSRVALFHRSMVEEEEEEPRRGPTPLLASRKMYAKRAVAGTQQQVPSKNDDDDDDDDDRPIAHFLPRGCKLVNTPSRNHLAIVRKSAMSPMNGCENAPPNQGRRTPAPFMMRTVSEAQISIDKVAMSPSLSN